METKQNSRRKANQAPQVRKSSEASETRTALFSRPLARVKKAVNDRRGVELTPIHRLKRFQAIRDRNLKKQPKHLKKNKKRKMDVRETIEVEEVDEVVIEEIEEVKITSKKVIVENGNGLDDNLQNGFSHEQNGSESCVSSTSYQGKENGFKDNSDLEVVDLDSGVKPDETSNVEVNHGESDISLSLTEDVVLDDNSSDAEIVVDDTEEEARQVTEEVTAKGKEEISVRRSPRFSVDHLKMGAKGRPSLRETVTASTSTQGNLSSSSGRPLESSNRELGRIGGRRPVREYYGKRKAEDEGAQNKEKRSFFSPSVGSPTWRYIPMSVTKFWTPRTTPSAFSSSTPNKNLDESLEVNFDERTICNHDDDFIMDKTQNDANSSRWACNIM